MSTSILLILQLVVFVCAKLTYDDTPENGVIVNSSAISIAFTSESGEPQFSWFLRRLEDTQYALRLVSLFESELGEGRKVYDPSKDTAVQDSKVTFTDRPWEFTTPGKETDKITFVMSSKYNETDPRMTEISYTPTVTDKTTSNNTYFTWVFQIQDYKIKKANSSLIAEYVYTTNGNKTSTEKGTGWLGISRVYFGDKANPFQVGVSSETMDEGSKLYVTYYKLEGETVTFTHSGNKVQMAYSSGSYTKVALVALRNQIPSSDGVTDSNNGDSPNDGASSLPTVDVTRTNLRWAAPPAHNSAHGPARHTGFRSAAPVDGQPTECNDLVNSPQAAIDSDGIRSSLLVSQSRTSPGLPESEGSGSPSLCSAGTTGDTTVRSLLRTHGDGVTNRSRNPTAEGATPTTCRDTTGTRTTPPWHPITAPLRGEIDLTNSPGAVAGSGLGHITILPEPQQTYMGAEYQQGCT
ncbi:hypothetical protein Pelo_15586 [Pelomyxa schiedti]|nr:hypothetical protein Pelo_15586 [Pelomyxa schiedti]